MEPEQLSAARRAKQEVFRTAKRLTESGVRYGIVACALADIAVWAIFAEYAAENPDCPVLTEDDLDPIWSDMIVKIGERIDDAVSAKERRN